MLLSRSQKGLSFIELMVSITILMIAIGGILAGITYGSRLARHNVNKTIAVNLISQRMEQILADSYGNITAANYPAEANIAVGAHPIRFNRSVAIATGTYKTITVTVTWVEFGTPFVESESAAMIKCAT
ncbi:MAG TPA: prepilin-type N-terminal cleavage/methylation domain-containing protein [bacterium]|nr:prepilin-type N-terminal cleavage/methylation domain-containing protein [bacterium]